MTILEFLLSSNNYDIICLVETFLTLDDIYVIAGKNDNLFRYKFIDQQNIIPTLFIFISKIKLFYKMFSILKPLLYYKELKISN